MTTSRTRTGRRRSIGRRLTLASVALVAGAGLLVLLLVYLVTVGAMQHDVDSDVGGEMSALLERERMGGRSGLEGEVRRRTGRTRFEYLLMEFRSSSWHKLAGSLESWPEGAERPVDGMSYRLEEPLGELVVARWMRVTTRPVGEDRRLLVGRDVSEYVTYQQTFEIVAIGGGMLAIVVAIAAGLTMSRNLLRRVEGMNRTILGILAGRSGDRVPTSDRDDEFEELAHAFNTLLDRNDDLVGQVQQVTHNIAHDLRSPLARMRGDLEDALRAERASDRDAETLRHLLSETDSILETFAALLSIAQIEAGTIPRDEQDVQLGALVRDVAELYEPAAEEAGIALEVDVEDDLAVPGSRRLLAQALTNLVDNALKHAGAGPITLAARSEAHGPVLSVADRGPGIPADMREKVLERFVRLDAARARPGTGLGLSFVDAVARLHGARLVLSDGSPGLVVELRWDPA